MSDTSDTWRQLQAHKRKQEDLRARLAKRRKERQGLIEEVVPGVSNPIETRESESKRNEVEQKLDTNKKAINDEELEKLLSIALSEKQINLPASAGDLLKYIEKENKVEAKSTSVKTILDKLEAQNLLSLKQSGSSIVIEDCEYGKLQAVLGRKRGKITSVTDDVKATLNSANEQNKSKEKKPDTDDHKDAIESLLSMPTTKEVENKKLGSEILDLLNQPTAKELSLYEKFKSKDGAMVKEFCQFGTRIECRKNNTNPTKCRKLHFKKIIQAHTDEYLGDCSFLNTCFHMDTCKYVHYEVDDSGLTVTTEKKTNETKKKSGLSNEAISLTPAQWIQCDVRYLDFDVLGKVSVIMADPPWDIHMELPYGTMSDNEMKALPVKKLQDDGYIFLWVTGSYKRCDELIWVKTNQLQRLIRTGRTGHWINHGKEHCIIGVKGRPNPALFNKGLDCDVLVSEVRDTSHKPDEIYGLIERLAPGLRKVELFGRQHNVQPNWITLGNQLSGVNLVEPEVVRRFKEKYPSGSCMERPQPKTIPTVIDITPQQGAMVSTPS